MITTKPLIYLSIALAVAVGFQQFRVMSAHKATAEVRVELAQLEADIAKQRADFEAAARKVEKENADKLAAINDTYTKALSDAKQTGEFVAADLRAGNLRLQNHWQGCLATTELSREAGNLAGVDGAAELRATGAGALVQIGAACDAHVTALQSILAQLK